MKLYSYQQSRHSLFQIDKHAFVRFQQLNDHSQKIPYIIERSIIKNDYFYYLLRDLWLYFDANMELHLQEKSTYRESSILYTFFTKLTQYFEKNPVAPCYLTKDFYTFLLAHFLAEGIIHWLEGRLDDNPSLYNGFKDLVEKTDVLSTIELIKQDLQKHEIQQLTEEVIMLMTTEFTLHESSLYEHLDATFKGYIHIIDTLHTIVGEQTFEDMSFSDQIFTVSELYQNQNLFEIADCAREVHHFLKTTLTDSIAREVQFLEQGIKPKDAAPIIICPSQSGRLFPLRHQINGIILAIASMAKKLERNVYILPISEEMNQLLFFESGQFTLQDIIQLSRQYATAEQQNFQPIINSASLFLRKNPTIKNGRIVLIADENLLINLESNPEWEEAVIRFKTEQKVFVTCIILYDEIQTFQTSFIDQLILSNRKQLIDKQTNTKFI